MTNQKYNYQIENDIYNSLILKNDDEDYVFYKDVCNITIYFILGIILLLLIVVLIISNISH